MENHWDSQLHHMADDFPANRGCTVCGVGISDHYPNRPADNNPMKGLDRKLHSPVSGAYQEAERPL